MSRGYHAVGTAFLGELEDPGVGRAKYAPAEVQLVEICVSFEVRRRLGLDFGHAPPELLRNFSEKKLNDAFGLELARVLFVGRVRAAEVDRDHRQVLLFGGFAEPGLVQVDRAESQEVFADLRDLLPLFGELLAPGLAGAWGSGAYCRETVR